MPDPCSDPQFSSPHVPLLTPEAMCDQQHFAVLPAADLLDDVEVLLDLQVAEALGCELHQLINQTACGHPQFNHCPAWGPEEQQDMHVTQIYILSHMIVNFDNLIYILHL